MTENLKTSSLFFLQETNVRKQNTKKQQSDGVTSSVVFVLLRQICGAQVSSGDAAHQTLDEGLFHVLYGASQSLSSISALLHSPAAAIREEEAAERRLQQLQVGRVEQNVPSDVRFELTTVH